MNLWVFQDGSEQEKRYWWGGSTIKKWSHRKKVRSDFATCNKNHHIKSHMSQIPIRFCWNWIINKKDLKKTTKTRYFEFEDFCFLGDPFFVPFIFKAPPPGNSPPPAIQKIFTPQGLDSLASVEFQNTLVKAWGQISWLVNQPPPGPRIVPPLRNKGFS